MRDSSRRPMWQAALSRTVSDMTFLELLLGTGLALAASLTVLMLIGAALTAVLERLRPQGPLTERSAR
ncbi:MAG TPA: hypothetical protein VK011_02125 [Acidimicrobiia bacterium]|nr:hypothetical protein [Acidimicrobiia bacterium]